MKLSEYRKTADYFSSSASSINRSLSFSGIAIVWIFTQADTTRFGIDKLLLISLSLLAGSLLVDLIQYCFGFFIWSKFHRQEELKAYKIDNMIVEENIDVLAPTWIKNVIDTFFWGKIILNIFSYIIIIYFLVNNIFVK